MMLCSARIPSLSLGFFMFINYNYSECNVLLKNVIVFPSQRSSYLKEQNGRPYSAHTLNKVIKLNDK